MKNIKLLILSFLFILSCRGGDTKKVFLPEIKVISCNFFPDTDECISYNTLKKSCNIGICQEGDCINGTGTKKFKYNSYMSGSFKNGKLNGEGSIISCEGFKFEGKFKDGISISGKYIFPDNSTFTGKLINGNKEGKGVFTTEIESYDGDWKNNKKNGKFIFKSGSETKVITYQNDEDVIEIARREKEREREIEEEKKRAATREREEIATKERNLRTCDRYFRECLNKIGSYTGCQNRLYTRAECEDYPGLRE
jgi:hypothetical protein